MKIATLPKSGTQLFQNIVNWLHEDRGLTIELDHIVMSNRPSFIDDVTPTVVTSRDPRGYFFSLLNWYNKKADELTSGTMSVDIAYRYFDPNKVAKWVEKTDEERLFDLVDDTPDSLMAVRSRESYDAIIEAKSKLNCYVTTFETFSPAKDPSLFGQEAMLEYIRIFSHLGVTVDVAYINRMLGACWGHSETYTTNGVDGWKCSLPSAVEDRIVDRYHDVYDALGYRRTSWSRRLSRLRAAWKKPAKKHRIVS